MFGGGGFGGGAGEQFAGGGFMPSQANETGYGGGGGSGGAKKGAQTLRTLTIRQLAKDVGNSDDDHYMVDGVELSNLSVIGRIADVQNKGNHLELKLRDGTGDLEVSYWMTEESEQALQNKIAELRVGSYVKAHGHLRPFDRKVTLSAFNLRVITNFNEVTYHFLRAIFEHLHLTKGGAGGQQGVGNTTPGGFGNAAAGGGGWGGGAPQQQPQQQQQPPVGGAATAFAGAGGGRDPCQNAVMQIIQASNDEQGVHMEQVFNQLNGQFHRAQVEAALQSLVDNAHLYNTVDDYHFKTT